MKYNNKNKYILYSCCVEETSPISEEEFEIINHVGKFLLENKLKNIPITLIYALLTINEKKLTISK
jgi:hypothetical protein